MNHTKTTARAWAKFYRTHSLRATAAEFGVSAPTVSAVFAHYGIKVRCKAHPSPAVALLRKAARAAKLRAQLRAAEG